MFNLFKSKKAFNDAVKREAERLDLKRKEENAKLWEEWQRDNCVEVSYSNEYKMQYTKAERAFKDGELPLALDLLNDLIDKSPDIVGMYVFILLVDVSNGIGGIEEAVRSYDRGISYYGTVSGENTARWREELEMLKSDFIKTEQERARMRKTYNFDLDVDLFKALSRLENIKVDTYRNKDYYHQDSFDKVWWSVLTEVDKFEQGEEDSPLNKTTTKGAKTWLKTFSYLCAERIPDEYRAESKPIQGNI